MDGHSRWVRYGIVTLLCTLIVGYILFEWGGLGPPKAITETVKVGNLRPTVFGIGTVQAKLTYNVGPVLTGKVAKLNVDQGDLVTKGQVIGEIDPVDLDQRIAGSNAAFVSSRHDVEAAKAQLQDAESRNQLAQTIAHRYAKLFASGAISSELLEMKQNEAEVAQAALDAAISSLQSAQSKMAKADADYRGQLAQKRNLLLVSPADGIVVSRQVEEGSAVVAGQTVYNIIDSNSLWVQTRIDQARFSGIAVGQRADIVLRSKKGEVLPGKVVRLEIQGDTLTEERFVNVRFSHLPDTIFLGDLADVTIELPAVDNCLYVSAAAIKKAHGKEGVWVVRDGRSYYRDIETGVQTVDGKIQITAGLEASEEIILYTKSQITEGMRIRLVSKL